MVRKPDSLKRWLASDLLNPRIFAWELRIGDWVEYTIDWALGWIDWAIYRAGVAYSKALEARDKAVEVGREAWTNLQKEAASLGKRIDTWWDDLGEWWEGKRPTVEGWIGVALTPLRLLITGAETVANTVSIAWGNFRTQTLPKLLDTSWITSFFGKGVSTISDWWGPKDDEITNQIDAEVTPVRDEVNTQADWWETVKGLITDPLETILGWLLKLAKTHQDLLLKVFDKIMDALWG